MKPSIANELSERGVVTVADHPSWRTSLSRLVTEGVLARPLPGTFVPASDTSRVSWLRAVCAWAGAEGALHAQTAASLWLPKVRVGTTQLAHPRLRSRGSLRVWRQQVPPEFVRVAQGLRFVSPAFAAVELAATDDGRAICEALRRGLVTPSELAAALAALGGTPGQATRRCVVGACMDNPWSYAELRLQRILRAAGIAGWNANITITLNGEAFHPDLIFREARVIVEFDGREVHDNPAQFLADRERLNRFAEHGYLVVRFGWEHLDDSTYVATVVRCALAAGQRWSAGQIRHEMLRGA